MDSIPQAQHGGQRLQNRWFNSVLRQQGPTRADPDVWIRADVRLDGGKYYEMLFVYADEILALSHKETEVITEITSFYKAK